MARWDEILSLPVQNPPTPEFSSGDLVWSKVEGWRDNIDRLALIPYARVNDFVKGESSNKDCPTRFHVEARRRRPAEAAYKPKVDGILEYILYWCSFGPDDHRKGGVVRPSRSTYVPKKKNAGRPNTKRGCTCHFIVKRLIAEPLVALIIYNQDKHVDKKGLPCHGPQDKKAAGTRAMFAPYISEELRLRVLSLLYVGVSVETIMQRHNESVEKQGGPMNRDDLLTHRYVRRQERSIRRSTYELDPDDAVSIGMWVETHQSHVFFYQDFSDSDPFTLGIQTEWQLQQMVHFGNRSLVASDSRFGTNKLKYPVHTLVVFNSDKKAIPVAWIITPRFASADTHKWMRALYNRVRNKDPTWKLAGFVIDDPLADVLTIRDVFECSVLISLWRARHAWHKNVVKRCPTGEMRVEIARRLGLAVDDICRGHGTANVFEDLMEDFVDGSDFMDYFKATWYPRIGCWTTALKTLPLASHETSAAMEFYHKQLNLRLLNERDSVVYQRTDWLVNKLGTKVHSYFWLDEYSEKDDFARYWKDEWMSGLTCWRKALKIPDSDVVFEDRCAKVTDQIDRDRAYVVWNPGSQFGICDCSWAEMGYLCEHVFKVIKVCRQNGFTAPSISLFQFNKALIDMLHCPPHDSLIRDYAVSLAVNVCKQLNGLIDSESCHPMMEPIQTRTLDTTEQQSLGANSAYVDRELVNENQFVDENVVSYNENGCSEGREALASTPCDSSDKQSNQIVSGAGRHVQITGETSCAEMDVDLAPICISPARVSSVDEGVSRAVVSENGERVLTKDPEVSKSLPFKDGSLPDQKGSAEDSSGRQCYQDMMDVEPLAVDMTASIELVEQCPESHQNGVSVDDAKPSANIAEAGTQSDEMVPVTSRHVESQVANAAEASRVSKKNEAPEPVSVCGTASNNLSRADDTCPPNADDDKTKAKGIVAPVSESLPCSSSMSSHNDNQSAMEIAAEETGSSGKSVSCERSLLTKCKSLERIEKNSNCDNGVIIRLEDVDRTNDTVAEGTGSGEATNATVESSDS